MSDRDRLYLELQQQRATIANWIALPEGEEKWRTAITVTAENHLILIEAVLLLLEGNHPFKEESDDVPNG